MRFGSGTVFFLINRVYIANWFACKMSPLISFKNETLFSLSSTYLEHHTQAKHFVAAIVLANMYNLKKDSLF